MSQTRGTLLTVPDAKKKKKKPKRKKKILFFLFQLHIDACFKITNQQILLLERLGALGSSYIPFRANLSATTCAIKSYLSVFFLHGEHGRGEREGGKRTRASGTTLSVLPMFHSIFIFNFIWQVGNYFKTNQPQIELKKIPLFFNE